MSGHMLNISKAYAKNALEKRSMFQRDFTVLLMALALHPKNTPISSELVPAYQAVGKATFKDLTLRLPMYHAKTEWHQSLYYTKKAIQKVSFSWRSPLQSLGSVAYVGYRIACSLFNPVAIGVMFPVNMAYGALDWLGLQGALAYFKRSKNDDLNQKIERATYISLGISFVTIPVRLAFGLVEALQEPLHLYDFWVKGAVDAYKERKNHEISRPVYAAKLFLHAFKVVCTLGAILSIVGITAIPVISKGFEYLGKIAYGFIGVKDLIPYHKYIFDMPLKGLEHTLVGVETGIKQVTGIHYSHMSRHANAQDAIKLGFESAATKGAALLPMETGFKPLNLNRI